MSEHGEPGLAAAREAIRQNDIERARNLLAGLVKGEPTNEQAWFMLAKVVERDDQTIYCLRRTLKLNPDNRSALIWLQSLEQIELSGSRQPGQASKPTRPLVSREGQEKPVPGPSAQQVEPLAGEFEMEKLLPQRRRNWPLILGSFLFLIIVFLGIAGPSLAPRDPLEENLIIRVKDKWEVPPFEIFTPGFPLGSDEFGRDLLSRLLWGIRPTMIMVLIVAGVRLFLGSIIGLTAGWSNGQLGRALDSVIEGALSIPVLLVALGAIAVVGVELGVWAFIIGLSVTGWVETAQQVREQTRITKGQIYVEAAHALGASNHQIVAGHVLKQITPMMVMLFAFELSSTLMTTAGLGFLGYYIGGDVWVNVSDFVARRISGTSELGQMLATSWVRLTEPWAMVAVGSTIFTAVLGFNLLGEGFRQTMNLAAVRRRGLVARVSQRANFWLEQNVWYPLSIITRKPAVKAAVGGMIVLAVSIATGRWLWPQIQSQLAGQERVPTQLVAQNPGTSGQNQATAGGRATPDSSETQPAIQTPEAQQLEAQVAWEFVDEAGFKGGPVLAPGEDQFFIASAGGTFYAFNFEGEMQWQTEMPAGAIGAPALSADGTLYISDNDGGLAAAAPGDGLIWHFQSEAGSQGVAAPVLARDGRAFYTVISGSKGFVQAVSPQGEGLWATQAETPSFYEAPRVSADERFVFLKNDVFDAQTGDLLKFESDLKILRYFPGQDGRDYLLAGNNVINWQLNGNTVEVVDIAEWGTGSRSEAVAPSQVGVRQDGTAWLFYTTPGGNSSIVWVTLEDEFVGNNRLAPSRGQMIAMRDDLTAYICGGKSFNEEFTHCGAVTPDGHDPLWELQLGNHGPVQGGFWKDGKLILSTLDGTLFAIDEATESIRASESASPGLQWTVEFDEEITLGPFHPFLDDLSEMKIYLFSEDHTAYAVNSAGKLIYATDMPAWFFSAERGQDDYLPPFIFADGTVVIVAEENLVYALDPLGEVAWEETLDAEPYRWSYDSKGLYLTDTAAGLYVFTSQGLKWKFRSPAGQRSASGSVRGPEGNIYYTVTPSSRGFVQAVSADGAALWATEARTGNFYHTPQVSPDGKLVFLKDDVFDAETGALLDVEVPFRVDEYLMGEDGNLYLRSDHTVVQWQYGEAGFEVLNTISWNHSQFSSSPPFFAWIDEEGLVSLVYRAGQVWLNPKGEVVAIQRSPGSSSTLQRFDPETQIVSECKWQIGSTLVCSASKAGSNQALWEVEIAGVPRIDFRNAIWTENDLYVLADNKLQNFFLDLPE